MVHHWMTATASVAAGEAAPRRAELLALGAALLTVVLWSSAFVGIRSAGRELSPGALALARLLVGSAVLGAVLLVRREPLPPLRALVGIALSGLLWFGAYNVLLNAAERRVDAGAAAMLVNIGPILIALLAGAILKEGFPPRLVAGCVVGFAGAAVIGIATSKHGITPSWGAVLCVIAALAYAVAIVAQKPVLAYVSALQVTWLASTIAALACLPFAPALVREVGDARAGTIGWAVYLGAMPTAIGFVSWAYALARTSAGRLGVMTYLVPPIAIVLAWAILGESPPSIALVGGGLCLVGVAITRSRR
jgi:drug/metabolite transporter (DMT)-like permease